MSSYNTFNSNKEMGSNQSRSLVPVEEDESYCDWCCNGIVDVCRRFYRWTINQDNKSWWLWPCLIISSCGLMWLIMIIIRCCCLKKEVEQRPGGIPNIGATCYANSVLQVLGQTPGFMKCLNKSTSEDDSRGKLATGHTLSLLNDLTFKSVVDDQKVCTLLNYIIQKDSSFSLGHQNDCHSFLLSLFNILKDEMNEGSLELFEGKQWNVFSHDTCDHVERSDEQIFFSLLIPVPNVNCGWSVEEGLKMLFMKEMFADNILPCRTCEEKNGTGDLSQTIITKQTAIRKLPNILILQIARFMEVPVAENSHLKELKKITSNVQYNEYLDMSKFCDEYTALYKLYAVISHTGNLKGGHYYASVRKLETDNWFHCSDSSIGSICYHEFKDVNAYVLLYERQAKQH